MAAFGATPADDDAAIAAAGANARVRCGHSHGECTAQAVAHHRNAVRRRTLCQPVDGRAKPGEPIGAEVSLVRQTALALPGAVDLDALHQVFQA